MSFYGLSKEKRIELVNTIQDAIQADILKVKNTAILKYASDEDTYIRKTAYLAIGKIHKANEGLRSKILTELDRLKRENI